MSKLIIGNLKMNMESISQRDMYIKELLEEFRQLKTDNHITVCPPMIYLEHFCKSLKKINVSIGAQDSFWELYGSYTGNTSPKAIKSVGGEFVILGHSERRSYNHETNEDIVRKIAMALRTKINPIVCVGFIENGDEMSSVKNQIEIIANNFTEQEMKNIIFAYEPVSAIGSGKTPTTDEVHTMIMYIRSIITNAHSKECAQNISVLYGGSVVAENVTELCTKAYADGVLVGSASLSPRKFVQIIRMLN